MHFPDRSLNMSGTDVEQMMLTLSGQAREDFLLDQVTQGNVPDFFRETCLIILEGPGVRGCLEVSCDHICLGTNDDFVYAQVNIITAQKMADVMGAMLPTRKIVDEIWSQSPVKLAPMPWGPPYDGTMFSSSRMTQQSRKLEKQRRANALPLGQLTSGNFKDYVLVPELATRMDRTCIYGWHQPNGIPIQGVQINAHERTYVDYSQAPRFCATTIKINEEDVDMSVVLNDPAMWRLATLTGPTNVSRLPGS